MNGSTIIHDKNEVVVIGIGEYCVGGSVMMSIGLGSCVGLVLHDENKKIGGLVHIMLPKAPGKPLGREGKYADTAIELLLRELSNKGCSPSTLKAKIAGGASMFPNFSGNLNIGDRNVQTIKEILKSKGIPLIREETGGTVGRTVTYYPKENGRYTIRQADGKKLEI